MTIRLSLATLLTVSFAGCGEDAGPSSGEFTSGDSATENTDAGVTNGSSETDSGRVQSGVDASSSGFDAGAVGSSSCPLLTDVSSGRSTTTDLCPAEYDPSGSPGCVDQNPLQGGDDLIIVGVQLEQNLLSFFNPTDEPIQLDGYVISQPPNCVTIAGTGITVRPHAYAGLGDLGPIEFDPTQPGEISLYKRADLNDRSAMLDFLCWNGDSTMSHRALAETNQDGAVLWWTDPRFGTCIAVEDDNIVRLFMTLGNQAADYFAYEEQDWSCGNCP